LDIGFSELDFSKIVSKILKSHRKIQNSLQNRQKSQNFRRRYSGHCVCVLDLRTSLESDFTRAMGAADISLVQKKSRNFRIDDEMREKIW